MYASSATQIRLTATAIASTARAIDATKPHDAANRPGDEARDSVTSRPSRGFRRFDRAPARGERRACFLDDRVDRVAHPVEVRPEAEDAETDDVAALQAGAGKEDPAPRVDP